MTMIAPRRDEQRQFSNESVQMVRKYTRRLIGHRDCIVTRGGFPSPRSAFARDLRRLRREIDTRLAVRTLWRLTMESHAGARSEREKCLCCHAAAKSAIVREGIQQPKEITDTTARCRADARSPKTGVRR